MKGDLASELGLGLEISTNWTQEILDRLPFICDYVETNSLIPRFH